MKHVIAYAACVVVIAIKTLWLIVGFEQGGANDNVFLACLYIFIYLYMFSLIWNLLQSHIKLADEISGNQTKKNTIVEAIDEISEGILYKSSHWLLLLPFYYWTIRVAFLAFGWLKNGYWSEFNTCDVLTIFCSYQTNAVGLKKIIRWIGFNEFGFFLTVLLLLLSWIASKNKNSE